MDMPLSWFVSDCKALSISILETALGYFLMGEYFLTI